MIFSNINIEKNYEKLIKIYSAIFKFIELKENGLHKEIFTKS